MSDNEFNDKNNRDKDPWDNRPQNLQDNGRPEEPTEQKSEPVADENPAPVEQEKTPTEQTGANNTDDRDTVNPPQPPKAPNDQSQYQNPQNPYSPNGQNNNPYGGQYGGYDQNQYNQQPQYWQYQQYGGQYQQQNPQQQPKQPKKKNTSLHVFLWFLGILVAGFVMGFCILGVYTAINQNGWSGGTTPLPSTSSSQGASSGNSSSSKALVQGGIQGDGTNPSAAGIAIQSKPSSSELNANKVYKNVVESVVGVETTVGNVATGESGVIQGTGIVATKDGYILTNAHVVNYSRSNKVKVILHDNKEYVATVVGYDKTSDIAVLRINANNLSAATFGNAEQLEIGDAVIAIGNPGGMSYSSSLTGGMVSALNRTIETHSDNGMTYIQTDAAINPGNSGGPLVNMYGQVVGINSNKIVATGYEGMGFAIPISKAKTIIDDLVSRGYVSGRSRLGITAVTITEIQSQLSGYPAGVMIKGISSESDLIASKVAVGDIITKANGEAITSMEDLYAVLNKHRAGETITLTIFRVNAGQNGGSTRAVKTKLLEDKGETQAK